MLSLYKIAAEDERHFIRMYQTRTSFYMGIVMAITTAGIALFVALYGEVPTAHILLGGSFLTTALFLICKNAKINLRRTYKRFLESITYRAKLEYLLQLMLPINSISGSNKFEWEKEGLLPDTNIYNALAVDSSEEFIEHYLESGFHKKNTDLFGWTLWISAFLAPTLFISSLIFFFCL